VIDGSSMLIGTISVVFRHVCSFRGERGACISFSELQHSGVISQYIKIHMAVHVHPILSC
jgi:hypothetical protein